jgi:hypothetical protein
MGQLALGIRELADMDILAMGGERIPVNSHLIARRWGPYFNNLLREGSNTHENADTATLRPSNATLPSRNSSITITPSIKTTYSQATTLTNNGSIYENGTVSSFSPPEPHNPLPASRPRTLYLPHTHLTIQALIHYLNTSSLPPPSSQLCSPQILCSLLQLARPYHIDGLLEAIVERLHVLLDGRNTAAIFNAAAMAAGGGSGVAFVGATNGTALNLGIDALATASAAPDTNGTSSAVARVGGVAPRSLDAGLRALRINTDVTGGRAQQDDEISSASTSTSTSASDLGSSSGIGSEREVWGGELSAVVGLQKRGLRGLMEGRRIREMGRGSGSGANGASGGGGAGGGRPPSDEAGGGGEGRVGLGIA